MHKKLKNNKGFTIIEVMIVLAIAGLIMLIVFLAVPALQRSQRNTSRKNDASRLASAVSTFVSNSNGLLPCASGNTNDAKTILSDAGQLGQLAFTSSTCNTSSAPTGGTPNTFVVSTKAPTAQEPTAAAADNEVIVYEGATCQGQYATPGSSRQAALVYPVEGSGNYSWSCISAL